MPAATLLEFARVNDAAAATTKKLQKYAILAEYFRTLDDEDLRLAIRFAAGRNFAATDERVISVGGAIVSDVVLGLLRIDPNEFYGSNNIWSVSAGIRLDAGMLHERMGRYGVALPDAAPAMTHH